MTGTASTNAVRNFFNPQALVAAHNKWRVQVGAPGLKWSGTLARSSRSWANTLRGRCIMTHSHPQPYGENIYYAGPLNKISTSGGAEASPQQITSEKMVDAWGEEKKWYDYRSNSCHGGECGHYTQVVWKDTTEVGCGMAFCNDDAQIWVCQYKNPGNLRGQKPY
ncbi:MAG: SCP-like extracellular [Candidatus Electrothrix sp. GM3_4]|nr:SCP-like extracellular [Candidatus Electrothrix sp. GM3_4]